MGLAFARWIEVGDETMCEKTKAFLRREWSQVSTKAGTVLLALGTAISTIAPQYAAFDTRIAHAGAIAGVAMILWRGKANA